MQWWGRGNVHVLDVDACSFLPSIKDLQFFYPIFCRILMHQSLHESRDLLLPVRKTLWLRLIRDECDETRSYL